MEEKLLKLMAQLGLLALLVYVLAAAFGKRDQVTTQVETKRPWAKGDVWSKSPVVAPLAQGTFAPTLQMGR
jgi:hypothetical protein